MSLYLCVDEVISHVTHVPSLGPQLGYPGPPRLNASSSDGPGTEFGSRS